MKYIVVMFLFVTGGFVYFISEYREETIGGKSYDSAKKELLSEMKTEKYRNIKTRIISQTFAEEKEIIVQEVEIKKNVNLKVDFFPQSPFGKWGVIFNDTCEEASALIAMNYIKGENMSREEFRDELLKMVDWENSVFGDYKHTDVAQTSTILKDYFGFSDFEILENPSVENMKNILSQGNIIIAPFYGVGLNPHYLGKGPKYHFMVIKGYTDADFIAHDVGTKHGEDYHYNQEMLLERLHDYDEVSIQNGKKKFIVLKKVNK